MAAVLERLIRRLPGHKTDHDQPRKVQLMPLSERVEYLQREATEAQDLGDTERFKALHLEIYAAAAVVYFTIPTKGITKEDKSIRAQHAVIAATSLMDVDEPDAARLFAKRVSEDSFVEGIFKQEIDKIIEMLGEPSQEPIPGEPDF